MFSYVWYTYIPWVRFVGGALYRLWARHTLIPINSLLQRLEDIYQGGPPPGLAHAFAYIGGGAGAKIVLFTRKIVKKILFFKIFCGDFNELGLQYSTILRAGSGFVGWKL
jgi:hypothetical protein